MVVEVITTHLEMTSAADLIPGRPPPVPVVMESVDADAAADLLRSTYTRIGRPHGWRNGRWSDREWSEWLGLDRRRHIARAGGDVAGMVELETQPAGDVEIVIFGLVPEFVSRGFGGHILTLAVRLGWETAHSDGERTRRVWLHTASTDHPHAMANYRSRGFRPFRTESSQREITE